MGELIAGVGLIPGGGTKTAHATWCSQNKLKKKIFDMTERLN